MSDQKRLFIYRNDTVLSAQTLKELREAGYVPVRVQNHLHEIVGKSDADWLLEFVLTHLMDGVCSVQTIREKVGMELMRRTSKRASTDPER